MIYIYILGGPILRPHVYIAYTDNSGPSWLKIWGLFDCLLIFLDKNIYES